MNVGCSFLPISISWCVHGLGIPHPLVVGLVGIQSWALGQGGLCSSCLETRRWPRPFFPASSPAMSPFSGGMGDTCPERFWGTSSAGRSVRLWWEEQDYQIHINAGGRTSEVQPFTAGLSATARHYPKVMGGGTGPLGGKSRKTGREHAGGIYPTSDLQISSTAVFVLLFQHLQAQPQQEVVQVL